MKRRSSAILALFVALLCAMLAPMAPARAASIYDDAIVLGEPTVTKYINGSVETLNIGTTYASLLEMASDTGTSSCQQYNYYAHFQNAVVSGGTWGLYQRISLPGTDDEKATVTLLFSEIQNAPLYWIQKGGSSNSSTRGTYLLPTGSTSPTGGWYEVVFHMNIDGSVRVACEGGPARSSTNSTYGHFGMSSHYFNWTPSSPSYLGPEHYVRPVFFTGNPNYPTGYQGTLIPSTWSPPAPTYVAMGDSFSSGEGNPPFESGTDTSSNTCHRSSAAYPHLLDQDPSLGLDLTSFVACSGAITDYIVNDYNQENIEPPQAMAITSATDIATISIGGNDIGFGDVLTTCTLATEEEGTTEEKHEIEHQACLDAILLAQIAATDLTFQDSLEEVFSDIMEVADALNNPDMQLVVAGYPNLFPEYSGITTSCVWGGQWFTPTSGRSVAEDETIHARLLHDYINDAIENAVTVLDDGRVHFVDPTVAFSGHELCTDEPWLNGVVPAIDPIERAQSYHPNGDGQVAYADAIGEEIATIF